jgi:hypothetical protein
VSGLNGPAGIPNGPAISTHLGPQLKLRLNYDRHSGCLGVGRPSGAYDQIFVLCLTIAGFVLWSALSDERMGL